MEALRNQILQLSKLILSEAIKHRRHLHQHPELSMQEFATAAYVEQYLSNIGITEMQRMAKTGVVAHIRGLQPDKKMICLRADMDALPIKETNEVPYKSVNESVMHACGHDVHTACLMGVAKILQQIKNQFQGTVKLIFQPSEETFPGGAYLMLQEGLFDNPLPDAIIGMHVSPELPAGAFGVKAGKYMASTDEIYLTVKGKGGHAATPHQCIDPILIGAHIITALQQIVSRHNSPNMPTVLTFGKAEAKGRTNIIPDEMTLDGTLRTFDENWRKQAHQLINNMAKSIAQGMGGDCEVRIDKGYPFLVNDDALTQRVRQHALNLKQTHEVLELEARLTAEDFAYYSQKIPACFYRLGVGNTKKGIVSNLHTATFDIDETAIESGIAMMTWIAVNELNFK